MRVGVLQNMNNNTVALVVEGFSEYIQRDERFMMCHEEKKCTL